MKHTADFIQTHCCLETRLFFLVESLYNNRVSFIVLTEPLGYPSPSRHLQVSPIHFGDDFRGGKSGLSCFSCVFLPHVWVHFAI